MKVTFISPSMYVAAPGIRMISSCLKRAGHETKIIFIKTELGKRCDEKTADLVVKLAAESDLIGISLTTNFFEISAQITQKIKKELKTPVIWGGIHPTVSPEECLEYADFVCRGEGEEAIVELVERIEKNKNDYSIKNIYFKDNAGNIIRNLLRPLIQDLDSLPFLDYDLKNQYIIVDGNSYRMDDPAVIQFWDGNDYNGHTYTTLITRGCPLSCAYCCNNTLNNLYHGQKIFRVRSVDNVIEEIKRVKKNLLFVECIFFNDDHFLGLSVEYLKEFSEKYKKYIGLPMIIVGVHPSAVDEKKMDYITKAGDIKFLAMGIQAASERIKKIFKRNYPNSDVIKAASIINKFKDKIGIICFEVILDNPWETEKDIIETLMLLSRLPAPYSMNIFSLTLYPGTELYELAKKENLIKNERGEIYQKDFVITRQNTYLNKLFFLVREYGLSDKPISPILMIVLTNYFLRKVKISQSIYYILYSYVKGGIVFKLSFPIRIIAKKIYRYFRKK